MALLKPAISFSSHMTIAVALFMHTITMIDVKAVFRSFLVKSDPKTGIDHVKTASSTKKSFYKRNAEEVICQTLHFILLITYT